MKKAIALNPFSNLHYLDHLSIIASILEIPFLLTDKQQFEIGQAYYPDADFVLRESNEQLGSWIVNNFDILVLSDYFVNSRIPAYFEPFEKAACKKMEIIHSPHGYSDKTFYLQKCADEEMSLLYGKHMIDMLKRQGVWEHLRAYVITGNYRYTYYKKHREFYQAIVKKEGLDHFAKKQPVIFYAPTWMDTEQSSTFFEAVEEVLNTLPDHYNLMIKLHSNLERDRFREVFRIKAEYEDKPNVLFLKNTPLVYPFLEQADIYLGDMSAVGYDFLTFQRPMFFLSRQDYNHSAEYPYILYHCGEVIGPSHYSQLYSVIEENLPKDRERFATLRQELYEYTFGKEKSFEEIKAEIIQVYENSHPSSRSRDPVRE